MKPRLPFVHFIRTGVLLSALFAVPGAAVCWNLLPQDWFRYKEKNITPLASCVFEEETPKEEEAQFEPQTVPAEYVLETEPVLIPETISAEERIPNSFTKEKAVRVSHTTESVPNTTAEYAEYSVPPVVALPAPSFAAQSARTAQRNLPELENMLKELGAKYYRLEKWGSKGELFRFSCYVSPSEPYQYQKYFQAIDSDALRVVESVIGEIIRWKNSTNH